jgi:zinc and cadmium transporter
LQKELLKKILLFLVSFATGALFGNVFFELLPEVAKNGWKLSASFYILAGIIVFFIFEKFIRWRHCHEPTSAEHPHHLGPINLFGDSVHNFTDGMVIAGSYLASIPLGIATTLAVTFHEIPQEIGDFGILIYSGYSRKKALIMNFLTALTAILGAAAALLISSRVENISGILVPFAIGGFIYIAGSDLLPELHKEVEVRKSLLQLLGLLLGIGLMAAFLLVVKEN